MLIRSCLVTSALCVTLINNKRDNKGILHLQKATQCHLKIPIQVRTSYFSQETHSMAK